MSQSYYELLGVPSDASAEAIEAAYRERAKETHPDRSDAPDAAEQFKTVARARAVLTDPQERARYDRLGHAAYVGDATTEPRPAAGVRTQGSEGSSRQRQRSRDERADHARADGFGAGSDDVFGRGFEDAWAQASRDGTRRQHAAANRSRSWYRPGADGSDGYRVSTRDDRAVGFTSERIAIAIVTFALYPILVANAFVAAFPLGVNLLVGLCTLVLVVYLLSVPETGVLVFGGWTLIAPLALTATGIGLLSPTGILAWAFCWMPFALSFANLLFRSA